LDELPQNLWATKDIYAVIFLGGDEQVVILILLEHEDCTVVGCQFMLHPVDVDVNHFSLLTGSRNRRVVRVVE
jgi:hypothetical protein